MKQLIMAILALMAVGCSTVEKRWEWDLEASQLEKARAAQTQCKDFAYRSKVAGSKYTEADIHISCMQRQGYKLKQVAVSQ